MGLEPHPDKAWMGSTAKGVDFLGYRLSQTGLIVAPATVARGVTRLHRLHEPQDE